MTLLNKLICHYNVDNKAFNFCGRQTMGSETQHRLPKIYFTEEGEEGLVQPGSRRWDELRSQVREALESHSCFEAVYDGVPPELRDGIFSCMKEVFALPLETKMRNLSEKGYMGYISQAPCMNCESLDVCDLTLYGADSFTGRMWPQGNPKFCEIVNGYAKKVTELDQMVRRMVMQSLGLEDKYYQSHMESSQYDLRMSQYVPDLGSEEPKFGLAPHTDASYITIIYSNQVIPGLEVQSKNGDWIPIDPKPNSFFVMNGSSYQAWSNGRLRALRHKVTCGGKETRYSVMLFVVPKDETVVEAPEELVDEEQHPRLFGPFTYPDYVSYTCTPESNQTVCPLTAYCGLPTNNKIKL